MKLDNVLLGLISLHPGVSGYQLKKVVDESTGFFVKVHLSQIYPRLKVMLEKGLLSVESVEQDGKPNLKLYSLTAAGEHELNDWLESPFEFSFERTCFDNYMLRLVFMGRCKKDTLANYLDQGIEFFSRLYEELKADGLNTEREFIDMGDAKREQAYEGIWESVIGHVFSEFELRIKWLKGLRSSLD